MYLPDTVFEVLTNLGMDVDENVGEFWFSHIEAVANEINKRFGPTDLQRFGNQIRWRTQIGTDAQKAVRDFIESQENASTQFLNEAFLIGPFRDPRSIFILDFTGFSFSSGGAQYTLDQFQNRYANAKMYPVANLSGIDLRDIKINNCTVRNVSLSDANLDGAKIGRVIFENSSLNSSSLRGARIGQVIFQGNGMSGADISGSFMNAVTFDDRSIPDKLSLREVSYFYLLRALFISWFSKSGFSESGIAGKRKHTVFIFNDTSGMSGRRNSAVKNYIQWYEYIFGKFREFKTLPIGERIMFSMSVFFSKAWTSLTVLANQVLLINLAFALFYHANKELIHNLDDTYLSAFYFSVVTFVTLGYGDMYPHPGLGQIAAIVEVVLGYISLGSFAFLIGHKVSGRY